MATIGDTSSAYVVRQWLDDAGIDWDIAMASYMMSGVDWERIESRDYDLLIFTTGPLKDHELINKLIERFDHCTKWAINVSLIHREMADKFDHLWVRDSLRIVRPEIAFAGKTELRPFIAVAYTPPQSEYPAGKHELAQKIITDWLKSRQYASAELNMDMYEQPKYPRDPAQVESIIDRADAVVSMRLHATVLGLKHGKPVIATDPISGGAKISRQAKMIGWPLVILPDDLSESKLDTALKKCLSGELDKQIKQSRGVAMKGLLELEKEFKSSLAEH